MGVRAETEAETMEEWCLLRNDSACSWLGPHISIIGEDSYSQIKLPTILMRAILQITFPLDPWLCQVVNKNIN